MKNQIIFLLLLLPQFLFPNTDICQNNDVWPFTNNHGQKAVDSQLLTNEVEQSLSQRTNCVVFQKWNRYNKFRDNSTASPKQISSTINSVRIINRGNSAYNGNFLRLDKDGRIIYSVESTSGCNWELESLGGNSYRIKNLGNSPYYGYYLRLHEDGRLIASAEQTTGCNWELESIGNNQYRIKNLGYGAQGGKYLRLDKNGRLFPSEEIFTGCNWEIN